MSSLSAHEIDAIQSRLTMLQISLSMMTDVAKVVQDGKRQVEAEISSLKILLGSAEPSGPPPADVDLGADEDLALALALSMSFADEKGTTRLTYTPATPSHGEELHLERRKALEEADTKAVLGDVHQYTVEWRLELDGAIRIGTGRYRPTECGASYGGHSNLCCYLSFEGGNGAAAVALKNELAPVATEFARRIGAPIDYSGVSTMADTEVVRAYVKRKKTPVCVVNTEAGVATTYCVDDSVHPCKYLYLSSAHFKLLTPA
jgi:hypothetical protein